VAFLKDYDYQSTTYQDFNTFVDVVFFADLGMHFFRAFEAETGEIETDLGKIRRNYFSGWFWIDMLGTIPLDQMFVAITGWNYHSIKLARLLRVGRLVRALENWELSTFFNIVRLTGTFTFLAHWLGCLWYFIVDGYSNIDWVEFAAENGGAIVGIDAEDVEDGVACTDVGCGLYEPWLEMNLQHTDKAISSVYYRWLLSVYSALCMLLGENLTPVDTGEFWVHAVALLLGAVFQAYIFGQVALLIADHNSTASIWRHKMEHVNGMMKALKLPSNLQIRIKNYYEYYWLRRKGIDHNSVFNELSEPLLSEISLCLHSGVLMGGGVRGGSYMHISTITHHYRLFHRSRSKGDVF
jgi:hypothetical protein